MSIELEDAASLNGYSALRFFRYVLLPLTRLAASGILVLQIIRAWNRYFLSLLALNDDKKPLTPGVMQFQRQYGTKWAAIMAFVHLSIVMTVLFYLLIHRYITTGFTGGELKG